MTVGKKLISVSVFPLICLLFLSFSAQLHAARYVLEEDSNVIGQVQVIKADPDETIVDVARRFGLGYDELQAANPGVDLWIPQEGQKIILPSQFILPDAPRKGVVINLAEMRLFYFPDEQENGKPVVYTFPLGIGREGWDTPMGKTRIISKKEDPTWTVPASILKEHEEKGDPLPKVVPPGPDNPLGKFALRLGLPGYLIHGTNKPQGVGMRVSHGCIRMFPEDISHFFELANVGTKVNIINQPFKVGYHQANIFMEVHLPVEKDKRKPVDDLSTVVKGLVHLTGKAVSDNLWDKALSIVERNQGIPIELGQIPANAKHLPAWYVQLGEFHNIEGAKQMATFFTGLNVATLLGGDPNKGYCRVLAGPFNLKSKAEVELRRIKVTTGIEGFILPKMEQGEIPQCPPQL